MAETEKSIIFTAIKAGEQSSLPLEIDFFDEETPPVAAIPNNIKWSLYDEDGAIVNSRQDEIITPTASTVQILLKGDDLALPDIEKPERRVLIEYDYNSNFGNNIPKKVEYVFDIENLENVS